MVGLVFVAIGVGMAIFRYRRIVFIGEMMRTGRRVKARVIQVQLDTSLEVNGRNPFRIVAQAQDPSSKEMHVYKSWSIGFDPSEFLGTGEITVYVDRASSKRYYMDTSFLPRLAR
ncbi:hypothetical protein DWG18_02320 [Lysobacter sp. TY2-98]|uniref:hypothetical protein n=1 Tax=Lysobacter sp. TY2-98 TaxID=2290922 RepID=UPI000E206188|nr:hypothetical protein [Lysobacter sp. TY2-98]AXK71235.1 hypothetical protein DWG18_02320 [Lysobacter sp. TY2-98]